MRSQGVDDNKGWLGPTTPEITNGNNGNISFEFQKGTNRTPNHHRSTMGKPAPSKWDDAQKWLSGVGLARGGGGGGDKSHHSRSCKPRNSNADDLRLIASASQREREGEDQYVEYDDDGETKNVDCGESGGSVWGKDSVINPTAVIRSVCVRDMGTEMTPIGSQEPSRTATPVRATTPVGRSPVTSPVRASHGGEAVRTAMAATVTEARSVASHDNNEKIGFGDDKKAMSAMEARAMAWDEAERAKFMARFKREEVKIQAWENHEKRKAEMEMKKMEVKAERMKARAEEKLANKLAATKRIAEERRANAEAKLNEKAVKTSEKADYIRRSGHLPSSFSFKIPSLCW